MYILYIYSWTQYKRTYSQMIIQRGYSQAYLPPPLNNNRRQEVGPKVIKLKENRERKNAFLQSPPPLIIPMPIYIHYIYASSLLCQYTYLCILFRFVQFIKVICSEYTNTYCMEMSSRPVTPNDTKIHKRYRQEQNLYPGLCIQ